MANFLTTLQGVLSADEIFVHTLAVESVIGGEEPVAVVMATQWQAAFAAAGSGAVGAFSSVVSYEQASAAEILDPLEGTLSAAFHAPMPDPVPEGTGTSGNWTTSTAVSLQGGVRPNGTPLRGRFYLPTVGITAVSGGRLSTVAVDDLAALIGDFFDRLETNGVFPSVWSRTLGVLQPVTSARIGDVPDTIRSRRNALTESYTAVPRA